MRDIKQWRQKLANRLAKEWPADHTWLLTPHTLCNVELGLYALTRLAPEARANSLSSLLSGYLFPVIGAENWTRELHQLWGNLRQLVPFYRSQYQWQQDLLRYQEIPEHLRAFHVADDGSLSGPRDLSVAPDRLGVYALALGTPVPYRKTSLQWATPGHFTFISRGYRTAVTIPADLPIEAPTGHPMADAAPHPAISVPWEKLMQTAAWMDAQTQQAHDYEGRLGRVRLEIFNAEGQLEPAAELVIRDTQNFIGMVGAGKTTLIEVLSVHLAREGQHVTIVVGDVISALDLAERLTQLGVSAAPILGAFGRQTHLNRLHAIMAAREPGSPLEQAHVGFWWLSTACLVDGLRQDAEQSIEMGKAPCIGLVPVANGDESSTLGQLACPLYSVCPSQQAQRDLVDAAIWIATPASLIYTRVAPQLCREQMRFLEMACRRSDLILVDEVDRVQTQLDTIFSPSQTLVSAGQESWLGTLWQQVVAQLNREGRAQLSQEEVSEWSQIHETVQTVTNRLYDILLQRESVRRWVSQEDYFTGLSLLDNLARQLTGNQPEGSFDRLMSEFRPVIADPFGDRETHPLADLVQAITTLANAGRREDRIASWLRGTLAGSGDMSPTAVREAAARLEFALLVCALQNRLDWILRRWKQVETALRLEGSGSALFQRPPDDYESLIPAAPMGNILAFQYLTPEGQPGAAGDLRFFRCMGVGRWLLLNLPRLFQADGISGPHVMLLSGTSWAGTSPLYQVQAPVAGILRAPAADVQAIGASRFEYKPFTDAKGAAIRISGRQGAERSAALDAVLEHLAKPSAAGRQSLLEQEHDTLPPTRQRILLLVGSYSEAKSAYRFLADRRPDWRNQMRYLVPDDDTFDAQYQTLAVERSLQRGRVNEFADTGAWLLIAPLLAVERGHNILNEYDEAALGAVYFLIRPHPRPNDINYAIHSINQWALEHYADAAWLKKRTTSPALDWETAGRVFRTEASLRWRGLLKEPIRYSYLSESTRLALIWTELVTIWQVIGRLVRKGLPARVYFCDAAFAPRTADLADQADDVASSLLIGLRYALAPFFDKLDMARTSTRDQVVAQALYGPFYQALLNMRGLPSVEIQSTPDS